MENLTKLLKTEEAANLLGLSRRTLEAFRIHGGGPRYRRLGKRAVRYAQSDLVEFVNAGMVANTSAPSTSADSHPA